MGIITATGGMVMDKTYNRPKPKEGVTPFTKNKPIAPKIGHVYYNSKIKEFYKWDGKDWLYMPILHPYEDE